MKKPKETVIELIIEIIIDYLIVFCPGLWRKWRKWRRRGGRRRKGRRRFNFKSPQGSKSTQKGLNRGLKS